MKRAVVAALALLSAPVWAESGGLVRVHLIGTGGPELTPTREGMATLIKARDAVLVARIRKEGYAGPLVVGLDRMTIDIDDEIKVRKPQPVAGLHDFDKPDSKF